MASWTNLNFLPGQLVSPSMINNILDNIIILSTHNHSGSSGDGSRTLSPNARASAATGVGVIMQGMIPLPHFMPASNSGIWGIRAIAPGTATASDRGIYDATLLVTTSNSATGASVAYIVPVAGNSACESNEFIVTVQGAVGPDAGCLLISFDQTSVSSIVNGSPADTSFYETASSYNYITTGGTGGAQDYGGPNGGWRWKAPNGLYTMRIKVSGKTAAATGFGASIMGIGVYGLPY